MAASKVAEAYALFRADMTGLKKDVDTIQPVIQKALGKVGTSGFVKNTLAPLVERAKEQIQKVVTATGPIVTKLGTEFRKTIAASVAGVEKQLKGAAQKFDALITATMKKATSMFDTGMKKTADAVDKKLDEAAKKADKIGSKKKSGGKKGGGKGGGDGEGKEGGGEDEGGGLISGLIGKGAGKLLKIVAAVMTVKKAFDELKKSVMAATEMDTSRFRLDKQIKASGQASGWTAEQMERMAQAMRQTTAFSSNEITQAQIALTKFPEIKGSQFREGLKAAGDLAAVMGGDLPAAAAEVGAALNEPLDVANGSLEKYGIQLTRAEEAQIKNAVAAQNHAQAQQLVLQQFAKFGGAAEEFAKRPEGAFKKFDSAIDELRTKVGEKFLPYITQAIEYLTEMVDVSVAVVSDWKNSLQIVWTTIKLWGRNTLDTLSDFFAGMAAVAYGSFMAIVAAAEEAYEQIKNIFTGGSAQGFGKAMEDAWDKAMARTLGKWKFGQSDASKRLEKELDQQLEAFVRRNNLGDKGGLKAFNEKPSGPGTPNKPKAFEFEFSGIAELSKKIQTQIMPDNEAIDLARANVKAAEKANALSKEQLDRLTDINGKFDRIGKGPANFA